MDNQCDHFFLFTPLTDQTFLTLHLYGEHQFPEAGAIKVCASQHSDVSVILRGRIIICDK